jgi:hypothetical protein
MRKLLIGVVILAALLVAADRISVAVAENRISGRLSSAYGLAGKPGVTIAGFPFPGRPADRRGRPARAVRPGVIARPAVPAPGRTSERPS